ncbi:MAG: radical SAM protein [Clostridiales bacterium]|nr:radical SAM protein [Clostridiales bacterium]
MRKYNIPIFIPHEGCPHDCLFCNQRKITGVDSSVTPGDAKRRIEEYLSTIPNSDCEIEIAYFGGSFTGLEKSLQREFLEAATSFNDPRITGIRMSTRPDYINTEILDQCAEFGVTAIELGVQTTSDDVLQLNKRAHSFSDVKKASKLIQNYGISLGLQMMLGMYGSDPATDLKTCDDIISLSPSCTRIYPTLVLSGTELESLYNAGEYTPYTIETAAVVAAECLEKFRQNDIDVIRIGLYSSDDLRAEGNIVAGPFHPAFGEITENLLYRRRIEDKIIRQNIKNQTLEILAAPSEVSKIIGQKRCNKLYFKQKYGVDIKVVPKNS